MPPKLGQAIEANADGKGTAVVVMEVNGTGTAGAVGVEFYPILTEANPITPTCINLGIVWPALWSA